VPTSPLYLEQRANLLFSVNRLAEARADYDRAVELADRPYLRFERADLLCALGDYDAALADLDRAIAVQPENIQFYPRRALARLAVGRVTDARGDLDHAIASSPTGADGSYARAAVLLMEGKPAEALADLDPLVARSDYSHAGLPRTVRLLAYAALDQRERAAAEFDRGRLAAAAYYPEVGYHYWFVNRGCDNAFITTRAGDLVSKAQSILAAKESIPDSSNPPATLATVPGKPAVSAPPAPPNPPPAFGSAIPDRGEH
jgi:tetratricopeptide (TPR) repeat protein